MLHIPTLCRSLLAVALAAVSATSATAQSVTVNFNDDQGPFLRRAQGYLYSWWHGRESPQHGNLELKPNSWRIGYWGTWDYEYQPMQDQGVEHIQVILTDVYRNRAHTTVGGFSHDLTWQGKSYIQTVESTVQLVNERGWKNVAFDLINEPDAFGIDGVGDWYAEAWVPAFRRIREMRPQAKIVGPGFFSANLAHLDTFLQKAKRDNVMPDILSQHLLDNQRRDVVEYYTNQIKAMLARYGLAERPISYNEYINPGHIGFVENVVDAICQAERNKLDSLMHSSWDDSGELPPWNSTGDAACFDGIMSIPQQRERACYWTYKFYGDMSGRHLGTTRSSSSGWDGVAAYDPAGPVLRVMLGGDGQSGNVTLNLSNVPAAMGATLAAHAERVVSNGNDLTAAPTVHADLTSAVTGGAASFAFTGIPARAATMVTIRPNSIATQAQVAKVSFSPLRGSYWKPQTVTLSTSTSGSTIRYTTDGSEPTATSPVYSGAINVPVTTTIRAKAFKAGTRDSEEAAGTFTIRKYDNGLFGEYFANATLSGTPVLTRGDANIDFNYGTNRLDASLPSDNFSARWTGRLRPYATGSHVLKTDTDDGVRLYIDNVLVIDGWTVGGVRTANVNLTAGQDHALRMEFNDTAGASVARLYWTPPGGTEAIIPSARLFPPESPSGINLLVGRGQTWKYAAPLSAAAAPPASWRDAAFDDSAWTSGPARIGWGGDGEVTAIPTTPSKPNAMYFRKTFTVANPGAFAAMLDLAVIRDDGMVVYLNGTEIFRDNLPAGPLTYDTRALGSVGNSNERVPFRAQIPRTALLAGVNTLAVEIHQRNTNDDDCGFDCALTNSTSNIPPVLGPVASRTIYRGFPVDPIGFSVTDGELFASLLTATATSSNESLIPNTAITTGGYGRSRTLHYTPVGGQTGTTTVTLTLSDGIAATTRTFDITVAAPPANAAPTISNVTNKTIIANERSGEIVFTVNDALTEPGLLTVTATSSNTALIPNTNPFINGTGTFRTIMLEPLANGSGSSTITLTVSDGSLTATDTFIVTVAAAPVVLTYNFDDNTLQGWQDLTAANTNTGPRNWATATTAFGGAVQAGTHCASQNVQGGTQDSAHPTLWLRSPRFTLNSGADLTLWTAGGDGGTPLPANQSVVAADSASTGPMFAALRNASTGAFVLTGRKTADGS